MTMKSHEFNSYSSQVVAWKKLEGKVLLSKSDSIGIMNLCIQLEKALLVRV